MQIWGTGAFTPLHQLKEEEQTGNNSGRHYLYAIFHMYVDNNKLTKNWSIGAEQNVCLST